MDEFNDVQQEQHFDFGEKNGNVKQVINYIEQRSATR